MSKYQLIDTNSLLYAKRMVREINARLRAGQSVYHKSHPHNLRVTRYVSTTHASGMIVVFHASNPYSCLVDTADFMDGNGQQIAASRIPLKLK